MRRIAIAMKLVHPRACGEYLPDIDAGPPDLGSPPRLRGIRRVGRWSRASRSVHPRACGEYA